METQILFPPTLPEFLTWFILIYLHGYFFVFRNWAPKLVTQASSCLISLAHGTPAVVMAIYAIVQSQSQNPLTPTSIFAASNTLNQNRVLDHSIAYFTVDLLHYMVFFPSETLFICHHLATLYVFLTCRYVVGHGAIALLVLLVLAEVTSCCQNVWTLAGFRKAESPRALSVYEYLSPRFYGLYSVCRAVLGPLFVFKMWGFFVSDVGDDVIPKWVWISWMVVITTAVLVSVVWVYDHWVEWFHHRSKFLNKVN